ncbi:MAG: hypothetical protein HQM08_09250 [Candidatus Riflebacteria bacterium]|nr:hypothetical protein [Candidatus Riflebacteria bacterium]
MKRYILLLFIFSVVLTFPVFSVDIKLEMKVGSTYRYSFSTDCHRDLYFAENIERTNSQATDSIEIRPVAFKKGIYVIDIKTNQIVRRRFVSQSAGIIHAFCEDESILPLIFSLPEESWEVGKIKKAEKKFNLGNFPISLFWEGVLSHYDDKSRVSTIKLSGKAELPSDKVLLRKLVAKGSLQFDHQKGTFISGDWTVDYGLAFANKEIAVTRTLWKWRETWKTSFQLSDIKP